MHTAEKLDTIKNEVEELLKNNPELRNYDTPLIFVFWCKYDGFDEGIPKRPLTSPESIRRCRQKLQQEGKYPCTDPKVRERRRQREAEVTVWAVADRTKD